MMQVINSRSYRLFKHVWGEAEGIRFLRRVARLTSSVPFIMFLVWGLSLYFLIGSAILSCFTIGLEINKSIDIHDL